MFNINFANDWIQTADLWYRKQPLYQLSHNHCSKIYNFKMKTFFVNVWENDFVFEQVSVIILSKSMG